MKKSVLVVAFAAVMLATVPAYATDRDGDHRIYRGYWNHQKESSVPGGLSDPASMPEPSSVLMLGSGLIALAGIGLLRRRKAA
jgi:hypothetical protein